MKRIAVLMVLIMISGAFMVHGQSYQSDSALIVITLLNQQPNPARAGDTVDLRFKIENVGGQSIKNVDVELVQDYPFTVVGGPATKSIANLDAYQTGNNYVTLEYMVQIDKNALEGQRQLQIRYRYTSGVWVSVSFAVNIKSKAFAEIIYVDKSRLDPGKETEMKFTITNTGNAPLQNLIFSWQEPSGAILPVFSSDTKFVKYLDVDKSVDLTYTVMADVNAKPGLYQLKLNLKSESVGNATSSAISTSAGVFVGGETDFDVAFSESSQGQTSLSVANTGNNPAQSVSVKIPAQQGFRVSGTNSAIIGNLDKGDYTIVSFQIVSASATNFSAQSGQSAQARQAAQQGAAQRIGNRSTSFPNGNRSNNLQVVIEYTDTTGERRSVAKSVPIQFRSTGTLGTVGSTSAQSSSGFIGSALFWVLIAAVVVAGFFVFRRISRRRRALDSFKKKR
jgi:hypothetical protein